MWTDSEEWSYISNKLLMQPFMKNKGRIKDFDSDPMNIESFLLREIINWAATKDTSRRSKDILVRKKENLFVYPRGKLIFPINYEYIIFFTLSTLMKA